MKPGDIFLPYAFDETVHYPEPETEKIYDVAMIGIPYAERQALVRELRSTGTKVFFEIGPMMDEYRHINNQAQVGVNWSSLNDVTARVFELMGMGVVPVLNRVPDLAEHFVEDVHYLGFSNLAEAKEKVCWAIEHKEQAKIIADNAHELVLSANHTYNNRVSRIMELLY
jgi:spore maturation protein CgeB